MSERLTVEDAEADALARELAERRGVSVAEAVVSSLRAALAVDVAPARPSPPRIPALEELTPEQHADYDALLTLAREASAYAVPGATSDHRDLYDERGLPI